MRFGEIAGHHPSGGKASERHENRFTKEPIVPDRTASSLWKSAPERFYRDVSVPSLARDADTLRRIFLETGLPALTKRDEPRLVLPPRPSSAKRPGDHRWLRRNDYVEVGIVIRGAMTLWWEGALSTCSAGSVFVIPPDTRFLPHAAIPGKIQEPHSVVWLALHRGCAVAHICSIEDEVHRLSEYYAFADPQITSIGEGIAQELTARPDQYSTAVLGGLLCLLTTLLRAPVEKVSQRDGLESASPRVVQDNFREGVESYLLSHYHIPLSLSQIAEAVGNSPTYVCRRYREITGQTPFQFLRDVRIMAAKRLLVSNIPIARVAEMVGFEDPLYFSKVFSSQVGEPPQSFRSRHEGGEAPTLRALMRNLKPAGDGGVVREAQKRRPGRVKLTAHPAAEAMPACADEIAGTTIEFRNKTKEVVEFFWITHEDRCQLYGRIKPGQHLVQRTHVGHSWLVTTEDRKPLFVFVAEPNPGIAEIKP
jgi:AraC-like DNA-binding protein